MSVTHADFTIERRYPYTPRQTFSAFAEPELRRQWFANPGGWDDAEWELDFRVGGGERNRGGGRRFHSRFHDIVDDERIVFAYDLLARRAADLGLADHGRVPGRGRRHARCASPSRASSSTARSPPPSASTGRASCSTRSTASWPGSRSDDAGPARASLRRLLLEGADRVLRARRALRARVRRRRRGPRAAGRAVAGRQHPRAGRRRPRAGRVDRDRRARRARACRPGSTPGCGTA